MITSYIKAMRLPFLTASLFSVWIATQLAFYISGYINPVVLVLTVIGTASFHIFANLINDYIDSRKGNDSVNREFAAPFSGGSRVIQDGLLSEKQVLISSIVFLTLSSIIGIYFILTESLLVLLFIVLALLSGFLYSLFFVGFYIGEIIVGLSFGTLIMSGTFFLQTGFISQDVILFSIPLSLLVTLILWINEFPDFQADKDSRKKTLVVRLGRKRASKVYAIILALTFASLFFLGIYFQIWYLFSVIIIIPFAYLTARIILKHFDSLDKIILTYPSTIHMHINISFIILISIAASGYMNIYYIAFLLIAFTIAGIIPSIKLFTLQRTLYESE
jgi:1,4-dihydroxy-2-naphthoate octaprenyltransferase